MEKRLNEKELIKKTKDDPEAFVELYDDYFPKIYNYVCYRVQNYHIADDITSSIFESVVHKLHTYRPEKGKFSTWIYTIAKNKVIDYYRISSKVSKVSIEVSTEIINPQEKIEDQLILEEARLKLFEVLKTLSDRDRHIISLKFWSDLSNREIAKVIGMNESNVGVIIYRTVRKLKKLLEDQGVDYYK